MAKYLHIDSDKEGPAVFANLDLSGGQHISQEEFITYFLSEDRLREQHDKYWREQELLLQREKEQREARERKESEEEVVRQKKLKEEENKMEEDDEVEMEGFKSSEGRTYLIRDYPLLLLALVVLRHPG